MARTPGSTRTRNRVKTARQRIWNAMRVTPQFMSIDLELVAETSERNLRAYLRALYRSGYLRQVRPKRNGKSFGYAIWRLVECHGPLAPIVRRDQSGVYDPNLDQFVPYQDIPEPVKKERTHERRALLSDDPPALERHPDPATEEIYHARGR